MKKSKSSPTPEMDDYQTKDHLDTLMRAEMIKSDPDKMAKVHKLAGRHTKALADIRGVDTKKITSTNDLKDIYNKKFGPKKSAASEGSAAEESSETPDVEAKEEPIKPVAAPKKAPATKIASAAPPLKLPKARPAPAPKPQVIKPEVHVHVKKVIHQHAAPEGGSPADPSQMDPADAAHAKMLNSFKQPKASKLTASQSESSKAWLKRLSEVGKSNK